MIPFSALMPVWQALLGLLVLLALLEMTGLVMTSLLVTKRLRLLMAGLWGVTFVLFQCIACRIAWAAQPDRTLALVTAFAGLPWLAPFLLGLGLTAWGGALLVGQRNWSRAHITARSIRQAVDRLPVAVCCFNRDGILLMKNDSMDTVSRALTGERLLNGNRFSRQLESGPLQSGCRLETLAGKPVAVLADETVYAISRSGDELRILLFADITDEYRKHRLLTGNKNQLEALNRKLAAYNREIAGVISQRETLAARVKIHDELGTALLACRRYLQNPQAGQQAELTEALRRSTRYLLQDGQTPVSDEYAQLLQTADSLGVSIEISGELPRDGRRKNIAATAMHEVLTNTLRHAHGDRVTVQAAEVGGAVRLVLRSNGEPPAADFAEKGGLKSLRALVEQAGGTMTTTADRCVTLTIILPEGEDYD